MKAKKLLAILLSLALLVGLMPVAGLLSTAVAAETDPTVYEITFDAGEKVSLGYYSKKADSAVWEATFEYYLAGTENVTFSVEWSATTSNQTTSIVMEPGRHTATLTATCSSALCPILTAPSGASVKLYTWNLVMLANDAEKKHYVHEPWQCSFTAHGESTLGVDCGRTTATVTTGGALSTYPFVPNADGSVKKTAVYVDSVNGVDTNDGSATDKAVKTLSKALNLIEASQYLAADIYIVGTYTTNSSTGQYDMTSDGTSATRWTTNWSKPVTIQSAPDTDATIKCSKNQLWVCGPTTFDNIAITHTTTALAIIAREKDVVFTDSVTMGTSLSSGTSMAPTLTTGDYGMANVTDTEQEPMTVTLNGGNYFNVQLGDSCSSTHTSYLKYDNNLYFGVNYTQNAGSVYKLLIGGVGNSSTGSGGNAGYYVNRRGTSYQGDVNVVVNGGTVTGIYIEDDANVQNGCTTRAEADITPNKWLSNLNGHAVQIILNNGVTAATLPTAQNAIDMGGSLYLLQCAAGGSQLAVTDEAGTYTVADSNYIAVASDANGNEVARSENGTLTVPAAGTYTVAWEKATTVYESAFTEDETISLGYYVCTGTNKTEVSDVQGFTTWNISFDYFLNANTAEPFAFTWGNVNVNNETGSFMLERGRHTATFGIDVISDAANYAIDAKFIAKAGAVGTLYAWNLKVTANGVDRKHYVHEPWQCSFTAHGDTTLGEDCGRTTADVTSSKTLDQYDFTTMDDGSVAPSPATTHAVQIRADGGMRFISTVKGLGAVRNDDGTADYTNATITVDGVSYSVVTAGTIFAREKKLGDAELVYGAQNVYDIPAEKLQEAKYARPSYGFDEANGDILFTGVITNIPEKNRGETLVARAYVAYKKGEETLYEYGDVMKRGYNETVAMVNAPAADGSLKVLAIGNSFSQDAMQHLWEMCHDSGIEDVVLANLYIGGSTLDQHWSNIQKQDDEDEAVRAEAAAYTYDVNASGIWTRTPNYTIAEALAAEEWDVITIQQGSAYSGQSDSYSNLGNILTYLEAHKPEDARIIWHMTWAYQWDYEGTNFGKYDYNQMTMYNGILNAVEENVLTDERISAVIPSGTAIQNLRTSYIGDTVTRDGFHMSYGIGRYTVGLTWYSVLTGRNVANVTTIPSGYLELREDLAVIQESVDNALKTPYEVTDSTRSTSPWNDAEVVLANETVYNWYKNYNWETSVDASQALVQDADTYYPVPVTLKWRTAGLADSYEVLLSTNADMTDAKTYTTIENQLVLESLFVGTDYYWQVNAVCGEEKSAVVSAHFKTANSPRTIKVDGVSNTRDIGGMLTELDLDGNGVVEQYRIKQGLVYRGAALDDITDEGISYLVNDLGIKLDLDLRGSGTDPDNPIERAQPLTDDDVGYVLYDGRYYLHETYGIDKADSQAIIGQVMKEFAKAEQYPIYFHCAIGRDRTGTLAMLLEGLLGASKNDMMMDYEMYIFSESAYTTTTVAYFKNAIAKPYDWIVNNYSADTYTFADSVERYLTEACGVTADEIRTIRDQLLEPVVE